MEPPIGFVIRDDNKFNVDKREGKFMVGDQEVPTGETIHFYAPNTINQNETVNDLNLKTNDFSSRIRNPELNTIIREAAKKIENEQLNPVGENDTSSLNKAIEDCNEQFNELESDFNFNYNKDDNIIDILKTLSNIQPRYKLNFAENGIFNRALIDTRYENHDTKNLMAFAGCFHQYISQSKFYVPDDKIEFIKLIKNAINGLERLKHTHSLDKHTLTPERILQIETTIKVISAVKSNLMEKYNLSESDLKSTEILHKENLEPVNSFAINNILRGYIAGAYQSFTQSLSLLTQPAEISRDKAIQIASKLIESFTINDLQTEGIFRLAGDDRIINPLMEKYRLSNDINSIETKEIPATDKAIALKRLIHLFEGKEKECEELGRLCKNFSESQFGLSPDEINQQKDQIVGELKALIGRESESKKALLKELMGLIEGVLINTNLNHMSIDNLSKILQSLLPMEKADAEIMLSKQLLSQALMHALIEYRNEIFA